MKIGTRITVATIVAAAAVVVGAQGASALTLYDNQNYQVSIYSGGSTNYVGDSANDKATSVSARGRYTLYEDANHAGRHIDLNGSYNDLGSVTDGLGWFETWNDRTSSLTA